MEARRGVSTEGLCDAVVLVRGGRGGGRIVRRDERGEGTCQCPTPPPAAAPRVQPTVSDADAVARVGEFEKAVLPSGKGYVRTVPDPSLPKA